MNLVHLPRERADIPGPTTDQSAGRARAKTPSYISPVHTAVMGRARLKIAGMQGSPDLARLLERGLSGFGAVSAASASSLSGNILVLYESPTTLEQVIARIRGLLLGEITPDVDDPSERHWYAMDPETVLSELGSCRSDGLSSRRAAQRLAQGLGNSIPLLQRRSPLSILLDQFQSLPVALLAGVAVVSLVTGTLLEAGAITAVVALNAAIGFATESRAERIIESLGAPAAPTARVVRDGSEADLASEALVPGDIVLLQRGTVVPADGRLIASNELSVSEAALTGESLPIPKTVETLSGAAALGERADMVYRGTIVTGGSGRFVVIGTGERTEVGRVQRLVGATVAPETPMQRHLGELGKQLVWATLLASGAVFGVGWLRGLATLQLVRSSLSVAVAAIPEGLPMVATTSLALGVEDMRRHAILVRRLEALETLAAVDVVCFDKTGTLTHGSMSLEMVNIGDRICLREGKRLVDRSDTGARLEDDQRLGMLLKVVSLCSDTELHEQGAEFRLSGSATENALVQAALDHGLDVDDTRRRYARVSVQHRSEAYRFMATTHIQQGDRSVLTAVKGSPSEVLARCSFEASGDGSRQILGSARRAAIGEQNARMAAEALRVLGVAYREVQVRDDGHDPGELEIDGLIWTGLVGLADPVRAGLPELMLTLHRAGIQTTMLTGDQSATARAVAEQIGLAAHGDVDVVDAADLNEDAPIRFISEGRRPHAFARVSPAQKLRIVRALQEAGSVVAMIGDGINDSPALRAANVGMAMGRNGDAAAREVADVFFGNDDLASLPLAIERGRGTYTNIRSAIHYILSSNTSEILLMLAGAATGFGEMLSPIQLLWINLISDVLPAIGLAMEPPDPNVMCRGPYAADEQMVRPEQFARLGTEAALLAASAFGAGLFGAMRHGFGAPQGRTMAFGSLAISQLLHALNYGSAKSIQTPGLGGRSRLSAIIAGSVAAQVAAMLVPGVRNALNVAPLGLLDTGAVIAGGVLPFAMAKAEAREASAAQGALHFRRPDDGSVSPSPGSG